MSKKFEQLKFAVGGFTLVGKKVKNKFIIGNPLTNITETYEEMPNEIMLDGVVFVLEYIEEFESGYFNAIYC